MICDRPTDGLKVRVTENISYLNLVSLAGEMRPFPSQMITLKSGGNQMKFTHGRNPPSFPIENVQERFWPLQLPIFYNGNGVGLRP